MSTPRTNYVPKMCNYIHERQINMRKVVLFALLGIALALAGCGASSADSEARAYSSGVRSIADDYDTAIDDMQTLFREVGQMPSLLVSDQWRRDVATALVEMKDAGRRTRALEPPPGFEEHKEAFVDAANHVDSAADHITDALERIDGQAMQSALSELKAADEDMESANDLLREAMR